MLTPTIKQTGSTKRERYLAKLAEATFFGLWSYPNLYNDDGKNKRGTGKEICDLIVVFDKKIIIFSDKDISFNNHIDISISWKRWFKKAIIKSCKQLYGAESWINRFPDRIFLDKECNVHFPISIDNSFQIHLVAVTCNSNKPAKKYFGGGSSSTFFHVFQFDQKKCEENPFIVGHLFPKRKYVHIFDEQSLDLLINELNTISDFTSYLEEKEKAIESNQILSAAGEEELLAFYYMGKDDPKSPGKMINPTNEAISLGEGLWLGHKQTPEYKLYKSFTSESAFWDNLIALFSKHIITATVGRAQEFDFKYHEQAVRQIASENRVGRYLLTKAFLDKFLKLESNRRSSRFLYSPCNNDCLYVFVFIPRDKGQDYKNYQEEREYYVHAYSLVAKYLQPKAKKIVVIATEPKESEGRSETIFCFDYTEELSEKEKSKVKLLMEKDNILCDTKQLYYNPIINAEPIDYHVHLKNKKKKIGRNEKCPCGSGKKYKKCCLNN